MGEWLLVWGIFIFLAYSFALIELYRRPEGRAGLSGGGVDPDYPGTKTGKRANRVRVMGLLGILGIAALLAVLQRPAAAVAVIPLVLMTVAALRRWVSPEEAFLSVLVVLGVGILAGLELVYVRDFLEGGDWYRMNSVFKFSLPAWLFLGLSLGVMLGRRLSRRGRPRADRIRRPLASRRDVLARRCVWPVDCRFHVPLLRRTGSRPGSFPGAPSCNRYSGWDRLHDRGQVLLAGWAARD